MWSRTPGVSRASYPSPTGTIVERTYFVIFFPPQETERVDNLIGHAQDPAGDPT